MPTPQLRSLPPTGPVTVAQVDVVLSHNLAAHRHALGLTQQGLADRVGLKRSLIGCYEEGRAQPPLARLLRLTAAFGITLDQLLTPSNG